VLVRKDPTEVFAKSIGQLRITLKAISQMKGTNGAGDQTSEIPPRRILEQDSRRLEPAVLLQQSQDTSFSMQLHPTIFGCWEPCKPVSGEGYSKPVFALPSLERVLTLDEARSQ